MLAAKQIIPSLFSDVGLKIVHKFAGINACGGLNDGCVKSAFFAHSNATMSETGQNTYDPSYVVH